MFFKTCKKNDLFLLIFLHLYFFFSNLIFKIVKNYKIYHEQKNYRS